MVGEQLVGLWEFGMAVNNSVKWLLVYSKTLLLDMFSQNVVLKAKEEK